MSITILSQKSQTVDGSHLSEDDERDQVFYIKNLLPLVNIKANANNVAFNVFSAFI